MQTTKGSGGDGTSVDFISGGGSSIGKSRSWSDKKQNWLLSLAKKRTRKSGTLGNGKLYLAKETVLWVEVKSIAKIKALLKEWSFKNPSQNRSADADTCPFMQEKWPIYGGVWYNYPGISGLQVFLCRFQKLGNGCYIFGLEGGFQTFETVAKLFQNGE